MQPDEGLFALRTLKISITQLTVRRPLAGLGIIRNLIVPGRYRILLCHDPVMRHHEHGA